MKVMMTLLMVILSYIPCLLVNAIGIREYARRVSTETERKYEPILRQHCREAKFRELKFCRLLHTHPRLLVAYSHFYLQRSKSHWPVFDRSNDEISPPNPALGSIISKIHINRDGARYRGKRSGEYNPEAALHRSKREIPGNPCVKGPAKRTTIVMGLDALTRRPVELFQNPVTNLYQTFYTKKCHKKRHNYFRCQPVFTEFMSAVFDDKSYHVTMRAVRVPTGCAMAV